MENSIMKKQFIDFYGDCWRANTLKFINENYNTDYKTFEYAKYDFDIRLENRKSMGEDVYADICIYRKREE